MWDAEYRSRKDKIRVNHHGVSDVELGAICRWHRQGRVLYTLVELPMLPPELPSTMFGGMEWLVDAAGCRPEMLRSVVTLQSLCQRIVAELQLGVVGEPVWHKFDGPGGVTGLYLLSESHLACHTYPEHGLATFNLYCCRQRPPWRWEEHLSVVLHAERVTVRTHVRGAAMDESRVDTGAEYSLVAESRP